MKKIGKDKIQLLRQALSAASSSLKLASQLLGEIEKTGSSEMPGLVGKYDGRFMVTAAGKKYPVPDNYSAKTRLIYGDLLKMTEGPTGRQFKLVEKLSRVEVETQLAVKDGQFEALGKDGSYRLLQSAVKYWGGEEGDKTKVLLPEGEKNVPFACLLEIEGKRPGAQREEPKIKEKKEAGSKEVKVEEPKEEKETPARKPAVKKEIKVEVKPKKTAAAKKIIPKKTTAKRTNTKKATETPAKKKEKPAGKKSELVDEEELR